jgi:hypothetical protein
MSGATAVAVQLKRAFPGIRITDVQRTQAEQDALVESGKTRSRNSQHLSDNGIDVVLPKGVSSTDIRKFLTDNGHNPGEFINETGKGANQGTGAHLHIGLAPKGGDPASSGSTYDRVSAHQQQQRPSIAATYAAYKSGQMSPQEAAQFENGVLAGHIVLPRGAQINKTSQVPTLPKALIDAYNSGELENDPSAREEIDRAIHAGEVSLPRGVQLKQPRPRTGFEQYTLGATALKRGQMAPMDMLAGPLNSVVNKVLGTNLSMTPFQDIERGPLDVEPRNDRERMLAAGMSGAGSAIPTLPLGGGSVANAALDTLSGATSGVAQETARQAGAGPVGQLAAGLVGGLAPVGAMGAVERAATRTPKTLETTVAETPRAAVIDQSGELTPHGQEVAARHGVSPEDVHAAYEAPPSAKAKVANDEAPLDLAKAKEATTNQIPGDDSPDGRPIPVRPVEAEAPPAPEATPQAEAMPASALGRVEQGQEFGVDYSRGQATKNFDIQDSEQRLKASNGPEAEQMRQFVAKQQEQVKTAVDEFRSGFDNPNETATDRGAKVQEAVRSLRDLGKEGVTALYKQARDLGEPVPLETAPIQQAYQRVMVEANVPDAAKAELTQEMARYGLIGKVEKSNGVTTAENGITTVRLDNGQRVQFYGEPETLRLDNADNLRKVVSDLYRTDGPRKLTQIIKKTIDDAVESAAVGVADERGGNMSSALKAARKAVVEQKQTFEAKDIIQDIADWKKGTNTAKLSPEQVMARAFSSTSNLKRIKAVLLSKPTIESKAAWNTIQAHGLASIFEKATTRNTNIGGEITDAISGAKLRTAIEDFSGKGQGVNMLKNLLEPEDFNRLMRLRRVIEDVTIPITGTTNPSGSGNLLMRLSASVVGRIPLGGGLFARVSEPVAHLWKRAKEIAEAKEVAAGTNYTPEKAATETAKEGQSVKKPGVVSQAAEKAQDFTKAFIDIYSSPRVIAPVLAASSGNEK